MVVRLYFSIPSFLLPGDISRSYFFVIKLSVTVVYACVTLRVTWPEEEKEWTKGEKEKEREGERR